MKEKGKTGKSRESGQLMLISVFLMLILFIAIPSVVWVNSQSSLLATRTQKSQEARGATEQAIAYTLRALSDPVLWQNARRGVFPPVCGSTYTTPKGMQFLITCGRPGGDDPSVARYQVKVVAQAHQSLGRELELLRSVQANLSQKTLGVTLNDKTNASAALVLFSNPSVSEETKLDVHWGPIVSHDTQLWRLSGRIDQYQYPRKFSEGGITGGPALPRSPTRTPPTSDKKEYWAWNAVGFANVIDEKFYIAVATSATGITPPICSGGGNCSAYPPGSTSGYFNAVNTDTATFDGGYVVDPSTAIYVNGNATFRQIAIDLKKAPFNENSAFIVTGNLILDDSNQGQILSDLRVPPTARQEYPFLSDFPCSSSVGATCSSDSTDWDLPHGGNVDFRGFLYVKGNLIVRAADWVLAGAVRVDGQLIIQPRGSLTILYDDEINHSIKATPFELQIDSLQNVPPPQS